MNEKPQEPQNDTAHDDILDQIITDSLNKLNSFGGEPSKEDAAAEEAVPAPAGEEQKPPEKNKRSSVYIYLLILFGAAFMMLLLAYFVQQRNNETTISDLRNSMNLSRTELMEQIETLKTEKESLENELELRENELTQAQDSYEEQQAEKQAIENGLYNALMKFSYTTFLEYLERFCREQDYLMAAVVVEDCDHYFNEKNAAHEAECELLPPQNTRYLELREEVFDRAGCMVLEEAEDSGGEITERPHIDVPNADYSREAITTAHLMWNIIFFYSNQGFESAAQRAGVLSADVNDLIGQLYDGPFQPSTIALYEQIVTDLEERGYVELNEDYSVAKVKTWSFVDDGDDIGTGVEVPGDLFDDVSRETPAPSTQPD